MRTYIIAVLLLFGVNSLMANSQYDWKAPVASKYMAGAVPEVDGHVVFSRDIQLPVALQQNPDSAFSAIKKWVSTEFNGNKDVQSRKSKQMDVANHSFTIEIVQTIYFQRSNFVTDFARIFYSIDATVDAQQLHIKVKDISYRYEEERDPQSYTAEEYITDAVAITKNGKKLVNNNGKFRTTTINMVDELAESIKYYLKMQYAQ